MKTENGHWYDRSGGAHHFIACTTKSGQRPTTIRDARENGWLPSVTSILRVLDKPDLTRWLIRQAVETVATAPRLPGEGLDAFLERVLETERQQDQATDQARDLGSRIHDGLAAALTGAQCPMDLAPYVAPVVEEFYRRNLKVLQTETVVVGNGYAGRLDLLAVDTLTGLEWVIDWKSATKLPTKGAWPEHQAQLAAYAAARCSDPITEPTAEHVRTANVYISTADPGKFAWFENPPWSETYRRMFLPCLEVWCYLNNYDPRTP